MIRKLLQRLIGSRGILIVSSNDFDKEACKDIAEDANITVIAYQNANAPYYIKL